MREEVISVLSSVADEALVKYKAQIKGLFGSFARKEQSSTSDIDILVEFQDDADIFDFVGLSLFLEEKLKRPVDVVPTDTIKSEVRESIMEEAIYL